MRESSVSKVSYLLNKNYYFGSVKLDGKTKAANGLEFNASGMHNSDTGKVNARLVISSLGLERCPKILKRFPIVE